MKEESFIRVVLVLSLVGGCRPEPEWTDLRRNATDCVVAVLSREADVSAINGFLEEHTHGPPHPGGGHTLRAGIAAVINRDIDGQTGYEICFSPNADPKEKSAIEEAIKRSPVVDRVVEGAEAK